MTGELCEYFYVCVREIERWREITVEVRSSIFVFPLRSSEVLCSMR